MKRLALFILLLFTPLVAKADWAFVQYAPGWYLRTNGVTNDGYGYYKVCNYCGGCYSYGGCYYVNGGALPATYVQHETVAYGKNWKERMVDALNVQKDNEMFLKSAVALGLQVDQGIQSPYAGYGYTSSGLTTIAQGFAAQGSTVYGLAAIPANPGIDVNQINHEFNRNIEGAQALLGQSYNLGANLSAQAIAGNIQAQTTAEVARGYAQAILANKTQVATQRWQTTPVIPTPTLPTNQRPNPPTEADHSGTSQPIEQPPPDPTPATPQSNGERRSQDELTVMRLRGGAMWDSSCMKCHGDHPKEGAPSFSGLLAMSVRERSDLAKAVFKRMTLPADDKKRMPQGGPVASEEQATQVASYVAP